MTTYRIITWHTGDPVGNVRSTVFATEAEAEAEAHAMNDGRPRVARWAIETVKEKVP